MKKNAVNLFFMGKGGTGKSTCSALKSLKLAIDGKKVLLVSLDPAHNLSDIFEKSFSEKPRNIDANLQVKEIDLEKRMRKNLTRTENQISRSYTYLSAFNLQQHFKILKYAPSMEEYALLNAYSDIRKSFARNKDYIVFDMPPTALALRFFALPALSLIWLKKLLELRSQILENKKILTRLKFAGKELETDRILLNINQQITHYEKLRAEFAERQQTRIKLVLNPERLSINESLLIYNRLREFDLTVHQLILNKVRDQKTEPLLADFPDTNIQRIYFTSNKLIGITNLRTYLQQHTM